MRKRTPVISRADSDPSHSVDERPRIEHKKTYGEDQACSHEIMQSMPINERCSLSNSNWLRRSMDICLCRLLGSGQAWESRLPVRGHVEEQKATLKLVSLPTSLRVDVRDMFRCLQQPVACRFISPCTRSSQPLSALLEGLPRLDRPVHSAKGLRS